MTDKLPTGWVQDTNKPEIVRAYLGPIKTKSGLTRYLAAETNWSTGATTYIETPIITAGNLETGFTKGLNPRLFQINSSQLNPIPVNRLAYGQYDPNTFNNYIRSVAQRTLEINNILGTDGEKINLKESKFYRSLGNTAPVPPPTPQTGGPPKPNGEGAGGGGEGADASQTTPPEYTVTGIPTSEQSLSEKTDYVMAPREGLRYPETLSSNSRQDRIMFTAMKLSNLNIETSPENQFKLDFNFQRGQSTPANKDEGPVVIAIQAPISDQNSVEWGGDNVNPISAAAFGLSMNLINSKSYSDVSNIVQGFIESLVKTSEASSPRIKNYLAGQAANINNVLARTDNVVLNPNMELLFNGPQLRPFTFTFKMSARSKNEAKIIKQIINYFKYHMAVRRENNNLFLKAPHVFKIQYLFGGESNEHPGINKIPKECALTNFSVDYTPLGSYATYTDGTMVAYTLNMQFQELSPIYDIDYESYKFVNDPNKSPSIGP